MEGNNNNLIGKSLMLQ